MSIPFHDLVQDEPAVAVAYLRFVEETGGEGIQGALFITTGRGVPLEFCFTRVDVPLGSLWPPDLAKRQAVASLSKALFEAAGRLPDLVLALAEETAIKVFVDDMVPQIPVCLVGTGEVERGGASHEESLRYDFTSIRWVGQEPANDSEIARLVESLRSRRLLIEPLDRAALGLEEAFER